MISLLKHGQYMTFRYSLTDGTFDTERVMIEEVWDYGMYVVRAINSEDTFVAFEHELS